MILQKSFGGLLILPTIAAYQKANTSNWKLIVTYLFVVSIITYGLYWHDKRQAQKGKRRVPENQLHLAEFLGGWPIAFLAQQQFRHKTQKRSFQITYWVIVSLHQYLALELAFNWPLSGTLTTTN